VLWLLDAKTSNGIVLAQVDVLDGRYFLGKYIVIPSCALGRIPAVKMPMVVG
jgi:cephalosporin hydroxylase